ncbi:MlaD family protein [Thermoleophilum album]|uniref:Phospholipid/cholesterol/gamma-HCH transport system substrate-binding protein n=1 Tax=Thermoleophilum album TaxID=29539 RepID=A0A1H6FPV6_THEAL|nr:MlaD family protein [Thermoleophilum album]SEH12158.1 phospholipid/cholesterol/gamma-HCH transport system substrate-binding protein [Thermoleophilum album]
MKSAIRKHLRDFVALIACAALALAVATYILSNQRFYLPSWVPVFGSDFYIVEAELPTGQALVPGQGQTVNIAGVPVGEIGRVRVEHGRAIVELKIRRKYAPVWRDASILLRPKTGLKDMYLSLDPGTPASGRLPQGARIPIRNTLPDVNLDEILAELDADARDYLRILVTAGGEAFARGGSVDRSAAELRAAFKRFAPTARDARRVVELLSERRRNIARVIHNFQLVSSALAERDRQLAELVESSNANFSAIAAEEASLRQALRLFPPALAQTERTLGKARVLADELGPALEELRPGARALAPALQAQRRLFRATTPTVRDELRPFARDVRPTVRALRDAAGTLGPSAPRLASSFSFLNRLLNGVAYNPPGSEEGYLFWAAWLNHNGVTLFGLQDAHGPLRRGMVLLNCQTRNVLDTIIRANVLLGTLSELLGAPQSSEICGVQ